ncbi:DNA mismatch repair protein MutT [Pseudomonas taiwanensis]|uniref:NUDIX domain-containing protein n=1 Tax=Pseudomonas taiwanensis TaxID=470150 RepID=UPI0015BFF34B|nr:NUDIX domain-containing protein [Pseudomonas taiwanensis]NWL75672.1 DNA mismatch repair protein MutT [Pseudomonas taiwanensis]
MIAPIELHATVLCHQADRILFVRKEAPEWSLPGGKIEVNELPVEAARRELREETTLPFENAQFLGRHVFEAEDHHFYRMAVPESLEPHPDGEIVECRWFTLDELGSVSVKPTNMALLRLHGEKIQ